MRMENTAWIYNFVSLIDLIFNKKQIIISIQIYLRKASHNCEAFLITHFMRLSHKEFYK